MPKTIFNTTEKSNFILNMKLSEYQDFLLKILTGYLILMPLFCIPLEFFKIYSVPGMALAIVGVIAMVFVFIGFMKQVTPKSLYLPGILLGGLVIWSIVSLINSYFYNLAVMGADGRSEGLLSVVFYGCFFLMGAQLGTAKNHHKLLHALMLYGLAQCVWGLLQALPMGFPSYYQNLEPLLLFRTFLPSGLTGSPIFLAILLVTLSVPAMCGAAFSEEKKQRTFYAICAAVFVLMAVKTQTLIGIAGSVLAILGFAVYALVKKGGRQAMTKLAAVLAAFVLGLGWVFVTPAMNGIYSYENNVETQQENGIVLYDGGIMWEDGSYRLSTSGYYGGAMTENPNGTFAIDSVTDTYRYLWESTCRVIGRFPLVGSGPDQLAYPQLYQNTDPRSNTNVFDRCYNYYLHLAGTLGIPALVLYLALMVLVIVRGAKQCRNGGWLAAGIYGAVLLYLVLMLFGASAITTAPVFWMLAGCAIGAEGATAKKSK